MRHLGLALLCIAVAACGDTSPSGMDMGVAGDMAPAPALAVCSPYLPTSAMPSNPAAAGAPVEMLDSGACTEATTAITRTKVADIVPSGYVALGPAMQFQDPSSSKYPHGVDFVVPCDVTQLPDGAPQSRVVVVEKRGDGTILVPPVSNVTVEGGYGRLHFHADEMATWQAAVPSSAGTATTRHYTFRALSGVSMGGLGSSVNFWRHPERYDAVAVMGADPGPDLTYTLGMTRDWFLGGFCTAQDVAAGHTATDGSAAAIGKLCATARQPLADQMEEPWTFEHWNFQKGEGVGLTLRRQLYNRAFRDLSRAFGNPAYATPSGAVTYLPPGVPASTIALSPTDACNPANAVVLHDFYDYQYNPDGSLPVITFCDGGDSMTVGYGIFDPSQPQQNPVQVLLAVDVNGNGVRDSGEPVVLQGSEPFRDVGTDGLPDEMEPGYDAATNPDPNHDDYHYLHNPTGTERNWRYDQGEPYDDFGVDGVQGKGCAITSSGGADGCYDFGDGNGQFDYNGGLSNWLANDPRTNLEKLDAAALERLDVYYDAGIRDFFNAQVSTNSLVAALHAKGETFRIWDGFPLMEGFRPSDELRFDVARLDFRPHGRHLYVRYGDPDATEATVENTGDGRHVGTQLQATHRAQMMFAFLSSVWPGGDTDITGDVSTPDEIDDVYMAPSGRMSNYSILLPPGYAAAANAQKTYPVVYLMHGYGMDPMGIVQVGVVAQSEMLNPNVPPERRVQKFIIIAVDAKCRPGGDVSQTPLPTMGDLCEEGTFYAEHPDGTAKFQSEFLAFQSFIEAKYRVKPAADLSVRQ